MTTHSASFFFSHVPPVMRRGQHALILVEDGDSHFVLGRKKMYPKGICRLLGGGINTDEDPASGAARELEEEVGVRVTAENLTPLIQVRADITCPTNEYVFQTYVYHYRAQTEQMQPADDVDSLEYLDRDQYLQLIQRYELLPDTLVHNEQDEKFAFRWSDYGKLYAPIHRWALEERDRTIR